MNTISALLKHEQYISDNITVFHCLHYCTVRQCWPTGQFWQVLYNQSNFDQFWENLVVGQLFFTGQFSFSLVFFFLFFHWSPFRSYISGINQIKQTRLCGSCIHSVAGFCHFQLLKGNLFCVYAVRRLSSRDSLKRIKKRFYIFKQYFSYLEIMNKWWWQDCVKSSTIIRVKKLMYSKNNSHWYWQTDIPSTFWSKRSSVKSSVFHNIVAVFSPTVVWTQHMKDGDKASPSPAINPPCFESCPIYCYFDRVFSW